MVESMAAILHWRVKGTWLSPSSKARCLLVETSYLLSTPAICQPFESYSVTYSSTLYNLCPFPLPIESINILKLTPSRSKRLRMYRHFLALPLVSLLSLLAPPLTLSAAVIPRNSTTLARCTPLIYAITDFNYLAADNATISFTFTTYFSQKEIGKVVDCTAESNGFDPYSAYSCGGVDDVSFTVLSADEETASGQGTDLEIVDNWECEG